MTPDACRAIVRPFVLGIVLTSVLLASGTAALAQRTLVIERFNCDVRVNADGTVDVVETIRPRFTGSWNGIYRTIPVEYRTDQGLNYTLRLDVTDITDANGRTLRYEISRERHYRKLKIWVPDAVNATRTVVLRYRVTNGLKFFDEHDELYWNVTGDEWEVPIEAVEANVILPSGAQHVRAVAFTGGYGSREQAADIRTSAASVTVVSTRGLGFKEGLTVAIAWDPGVVTRPTTVDRAVGAVRSNAPFGIPLVVLGIMYWLWHTRGRDPRLRPIAPQYEPPHDLTPAELGTLIDGSPDMRDITATIVDLAVRGFIHIEERQEAKFFGLFNSRDYVFTLRKPRRDWTALMRHERELLDALFTSGETDAPSGPLASVELSDLQNRFYKDLPAIKTALYDSLIGKGYYTRRPDRVRMVFIVAALVCGLIVLLVGLWVSDRLGMAPLPVIIAAVASVLIIVGFGWVMPARTAQGTRVLEGTLGFEEFLRRVEGDRFERTIKTPALFERFLPHAMAFGVEKNWAKAFEGIFTEPPSWYTGSGVPQFRASTFAGDLGRMSATAAAAMASSPRGSGGSGFSGGSSGGGFGGGGGGGF